MGRPNVGKSTLFNRLTGTRHAIVSDEAGTTRDRQYGKCQWGDSEFSLIDTGGWVVNSDDIFEGEIRKQVLLATQEADVIVFLVDAKNGVTDLDDQMAMPGYAIYSASKFGLEGFQQAIRLEKPENMKFTCLYPVATDTNFFKVAANGVQFEKPFPVQSPSVVARKMVKGLEYNQKKRVANKPSKIKNFNQCGWAMLMEFRRQYPRAKGLHPEGQQYPKHPYGSPSRSGRAGNTTSCWSGGGCLPACNLP